jgi:ribosomal protein S6--L-glutamate ligase
MRLITFDPYRTLGLPGVVPMKPEEMFRRRAELQAADWLLFPEEWQLNALVYALRARVFPSVSSYRFGQDKIQFTRALWALSPESMPETLILPAGERGMEQALEQFSLPLVVKQPRASMGVGVHLVEERVHLRRLVQDLEVLYVQEYLEIERDLRVVWIGDAIVTAYWRVGGDGFHHNISRGGSESFEDIPQEPLRLVERIARALGIDHGGFDLAQAGGQWYFLELNVRFGNIALTRRGIRVEERILEYLERVTAPRGNHPDRPPFRAAG